MTGKQLIRLLKQNGWELERIQGSHHIMVKGAKTLSVPVHGNKDLGKGLFACITEAGRFEMILSYPAKITYFKKDKSYLVEFPDLPGCLTEGTSLDDAKSNAKEALTGYLASIFEREHKIPDPSKIKGRNVYLIEPEPEVSVPIILRKLRLKKKLTQGDIAKALGISYQAYQRLEKPGKSNPTLKTLERLAAVFNKDLRLEFA